MQMMLDHEIPLHRWIKQVAVLEKNHSREENTTFIAINDKRNGTITLKLGTANTEDTPRRFRCSHMQHPIYKALAELGRASKTIFLCRYLHSLEMGREIREGSMGTDGCYAALKSRKKLRRSCCPRFECKCP